jgi:Flp pilus assembly protein TadD
VEQLQIPAKAVKELRAAGKDSASGDIQGAASHLEKALLLYPEFAEGHNTLGIQYVRLKQFDKAITEFRAAATINPHMAEAVNNQTAVLFLVGRNAEAESAARHCLDLDPQHKSARYLLGRILVAENQNTPEALGLLRESRSDYPTARLALAQALLKRGEVSEAVAELRAYLDVPNAGNKDKIASALASIKNTPVASTQSPN